MEKREPQNFLEQHALRALQAVLNDLTDETTQSLLGVPEAASTTKAGDVAALPALAPLERLVERLKRFADSLEERQHLHPCLPAYTKAARLYADELASVLASLQKEQP